MIPASMGTEMLPDGGMGQANFRHAEGASPFVATHAAVSVELTRAEVFAIARREGWRAIELSRGSNSVIEFWIENAVMLELMTPDMTQDYLAATERFRASCSGPRHRPTPARCAWCCVRRDCSATWKRSNATPTPTRRRCAWPTLSD